MTWNFFWIWHGTSTLYLPLLVQPSENWLCREFGTEAGEKLLPAMLEFYRLCGIRKPEFMGWNQVELDKKKYIKDGLRSKTQISVLQNSAEN